MFVLLREAVVAALSCCTCCCFMVPPRQVVQQGNTRRCVLHSNVSLKTARQQQHMTVGCSSSERKYSRYVVSSQYLDDLDISVLRVLALKNVLVQWILPCTRLSVVGYFCGLLQYSNVFGKYAPRVTPSIGAPNQSTECACRYDYFFAKWPLVLRGGP